MDTIEVNISEKLRTKLIISIYLIITFLFLIYNLFYQPYFMYLGIGALIFSIFLFSSFEHLFLIALLIPNLYMFKILGYDNAILSYFFLLVDIKYIINYLPRIRINICLILHFFSVLITVVFVNSFSLFAGLLRFTLSYIFYFSLYPILKRKGEERRLIDYYIIGVIIAIITGLLYSFVNDKLFNGFFGGINTGRNYFGFVVAPIFPIVIYSFLSLETTLHQKFLYLTALFFSIISVILSGSRTVALSLIFSILLLLLYFLKGKNIKGLICFIFPTTMLLFIVYFFFNDSIDFLINRFFSDNFESGNERFYLWEFYLSKLDDSVFSFLFGHEPSDVLFARGEVLNVEHNTFIQSLYTIGVVGTLTMFFSVLTIMRKIMGNKITMTGTMVIVVVLYCACGINLLYSEPLIFLLILSSLIFNQVNNNSIKLYNEFIEQ